MYSQIETERLRIRPVLLDDKRFILDLVNTKAWLQFIGDRNVKDEKEAEEYIQRILNNRQFFYNVFEIKETRQPIGIVSFLYRANFQFPDIGFAILPAFENKGYTFEATEAYLNEVKSTIAENKILSITLPDNENSIRLIEKLGLKYEDEYIDQEQTLHIFSMPLSE